MNVDMRRFAYRLDSVRSKNGWELDAKLLALRTCRLRLDECDAVLAQLRQTKEQTLERMNGTHVLRMDPQLHASTMHFLLTLDERIRIDERRREELEKDLEDVRAQCARLQTRLDQLDDHKRKCVAEFVVSEGARVQATSDADWLLRAAWNARTKETS